MRAYHYLKCTVKCYSFKIYKNVLITVIISAAPFEGFFSSIEVITHIFKYRKCYQIVFKDPFISNKKKIVNVTIFIYVVILVINKT